MTNHVARNTLVNIAGSLLPMVLVLVTVPAYLGRIGEARYGVLALVWLWIGYFSIIDLGLSRATTHQMASLNGDSGRERQSLFWTAMLLNGAFGLGGGLALWGAGSLVVGRILEVPPNIRVELQDVVPWIAAGVPLATMGGVLNGTLEARGRFLSQNLVQLLGSTLFQLVPLGVAYLHGPDLAWLIPAAILAKTAAFAPLLMIAIRSVEADGRFNPSRRWVRGLMGYGGWITASNLLGAVVSSFDQVLVGSVLGTREVAWYAVPFNLLWRLAIFPTSLMRTLFPSLAQRSPEEALLLANRGFRLVGASFLPVVVAAGLLLRPFMVVWLGADFAEKAAPVGLVLLPGIWLYAVVTIPLSAIQARGRPDIVAKVQLAETAPFLGLLWLSLNHFGVTGAAGVWVIRNLIYAVSFAWLCPIDKATMLDLWPAPLTIGCVVALAALVPFGNAIYIASAVVLLGGAVAWSLWREPRLWELAVRWPRRAERAAR
jgi:O-antigen/teichoic acid export membrane protein